MAAANKQFNVLIHTSKAENSKTINLAQGEGVKGQPVTVKAQADARYQLQDVSKNGQTPNTVKLNRSGKNLQVTFGDGQGPHLIIEDYYEVFTEGQTNLYGLAQDGSMYEYVSIDSANQASVLSLKDGAAPVTQALGGSAVDAAFELSGFPLVAAPSALLGFAAFAADAVGIVSIPAGGNAAAIAALKTLQDAAQANNATPSVETYAAAGISGVNQDNLTAINSALNSKAITGDAANTIAKVQEIVNAYVKILAKAAGANSEDPAVSDYAAIGVTGVKDGAQIKFLNDALHGKDTAQVSSVDELNKLAAAAGAVANATGTTSGAPSKVDLEALGFTNVTDSNLAAVQNAITKAYAKVPPPSSLTDLYKVVDSTAVASASSAATDAVMVATDAAAKATTATATVDAVVAKLSTPPTMAELQAVTDAQAAATVAAAAAKDAADAAKAAVDAAKAATAAAGETTSSALNAAASAATAAQATGGKGVTDAAAAVGKAEAVTDAAVAAYGTAAASAATAATTAAIEVETAKANLAAAVAALGNPPTPDQLAAVETAQATATTAATDAAAKATAATAAATAAHNAAVAAGEIDPAGVAAATAAATTANTAATVANTAATNSESTTDAAVASYVATANTANTNAGTAQGNFNTAQSALASALTAMSNPATSTELAAVDTAKTNLQTASIDLATAKATAQTAVDNAQAAASAANETSDLSAVTTAITGANTATASVAKTLALATIEAAAQGNTATAISPSVADYAAAGVTVDSTRLASMNDALNDADVKAINVNSTGSIQTVVNGYNAVLMAADGIAGNAGANAPLFADYAAIGVNYVTSTASASLLSDWADAKRTTDVDTIAKLQAKADSVKVIMDMAALNLTVATALVYTTTYPTLQTALANLGVTGVNDNNVGAVYVAIRDSANDGSAVSSLSKLQAVVSAANDRPVAVTGPTASVKITTNEDSVLEFFIQDKLTGLVTDGDVGSFVKGIAISSIRAMATEGVWTYSANNGTSWNNFSSSVMLASGENYGSAIYLSATDKLRFTPTANYNGGTGGINFRAVDNSFADTTSGTAVNIGSNGRSGEAMTTGSLNFWVSVTTFNDAPVVAATPAVSLNATTTSIAAPLDGNMTAGQTVSGLLAAVSDVDTGALKGMAIGDINGNGTLYYSIDGGAHWLSRSGGSHADLLHLSGNSRVFYKTNTTGTIANAFIYKAWDQTNIATVAVGTTSTPTAVGGSTAYSQANGLVGIAVTPVVIDLNHDGVFNYGNVAMDVDGDGHLDQTAWAGAQDGVLVWDKLGDGKVHDNSQYAFSQYGAVGSTDLQGLAAGFDSNHDGKFNAADDKFAQFSVWQDTNQNGVVDAGEMRSLAGNGLAEINLISDGVHRAPVYGVTEAGRTTATATDDSSVLVSDAGFTYSSLAYSADTVTGLGARIDLLGSSMHLDLSSIVAVHSNVSAVDLTGTGANTLKLNLSDVLGTVSTNGMHTLKLAGDANDTIDLNMSEWASTGTTVTEGVHTYTAYNANASVAAQLLIDQHMVMMQHG